jgi:predicted MFS family arabinose efflux permease
MDTSASCAGGITRTSGRGWAVALLSRLQMSSIILVSYTFGVFLPFISQDLRLSPLEVGLLQGVWWVTSALLSLPCSLWFSGFRPAPLVLVSLLLGLPFLFLQGLAQSFMVLFLARFLFVLCHVISTPARPLLLQQWVAPCHYALVNAVGLSQHSVLLAAAMSSSAWLIIAVGSWRFAYGILAVLLLMQTLAWMMVAREGRAPVIELQPAVAVQAPSPIKALWSYPQGWLLGFTMLALSATWTAMVTFLPTLLLEQHRMPPALSGPLLGCLYYGLIPGALLGGVLEKKVHNRQLLLWVPALGNTLFGMAIPFTSSLWLLMGLLTGMGMMWIVSPVIEVLPFEFPGIRPREVAVIVSLIKTLSGLGFALGPLMTGVVAQLVDSLQTGLLVLCLLTGISVITGLFYPSCLKNAAILGEATMSPPMESSCQHTSASSLLRFIEGRPSRGGNQ